MPRPGLSDAAAAAFLESALAAFERAAERAGRHEARFTVAGQRVRVRGQVTKVTAGVQGHTFFHLRDGKPGEPTPATDLVVTSDATPERGQVATFEGTLRADADVGIGFKYPILLENAVRIGD